MSFDNDDNKQLPFADYEFPTDITVDRKPVDKSKRNHKRRKPKGQQLNLTNNEKDPNAYKKLTYVYFENTQEENNFITFIPYIGPSNTLHLGTNLYLPQLISNPSQDSTISSQHFIKDYDETITSLTPSLETMPLSIYIRFGISYILKHNRLDNQPISLKEFLYLRNQNKSFRTSFYTCKGVTSPKRLITSITKLNYRQICSNQYSYEIQIHGTKNNQYPILYFQYDEQFQCRSVYYRPDYPINFDFSRNKTSSIFNSIDNSYSDIFDFRIQLTQVKYLSITDSDVLHVLRGVPINEVLFIDPLTHMLHISPKLHKFVKYFKCTRSSNYENSQEQILICIGTYEEFQLNSKGQCELLMKASNTMTIEFINKEIIPSGKQLYDIGLWFSTLCQTCVDLPTTKIKDKNSTENRRWFSGLVVFQKRHNQSIKQMNVRQLTTYKTKISNQTYTSDELAFVKKILQEENLRNIFLNTNEEKCSNIKELEQSFENIKQKLITTAVPSANEALGKVERTYQILYEEFKKL
ncbi:unnamed protein product [Adineta steineri]|uniref:Uncharacterized protein n=3 Tax=Adineta steineri TaxID=433720 RepID=A0A814NU77_9BILA|nr:unnamed protein product [Adineta steineri]